MVWRERIVGAVVVGEGVGGHGGLIGTLEVDAAVGDVVGGVQVQDGLVDVGFDGLHALQSVTADDEGGLLVVDEG